MRMYNPDFARYVAGVMVDLDHRQWPKVPVTSSLTISESGKHKTCKGKKAMYLTFNRCGMFNISFPESCEVGALSLNLDSEENGKYYGPCYC